MTDKSPSKSLSKKSSQCLKEKRAEKRAKEDETSGVESTFHPKKH